jgi:hypothetical protein
VGPGAPLRYADPVTTVASLIERAQAGLDALGLLGEDVEDEWSFVTDLVAAQTRRFDSIAERRGTQDASDAAIGAIDELLRETALIDDPHRAIDWLSTMPDLVALSLDEPIGGTA